MSFTPKVKYLREAFYHKEMSKVVQATLILEASGNALLYISARDGEHCGYFTMAHLIRTEELGDFYIDIANNAYVNVDSRSELQQVGTAIFDLRDENLEKDQPWTHSNS